MRLAPGGDYGDRQALERLQQAAPMANSAQGPAPVPNPVGGALRPNYGGALRGPGDDGYTHPNAFTGPGLMDPSGRPGEPVTHGAALGAGAGPEALVGGQPQTAGQGPMTQMLTSFAAGGATGALADLIRQAQLRNL